MNIGERLKNRREELGLTLEAVGEWVGVNKATIYRYETGEVDIKRTVAIALAEILRTTPSYIMGWSDIVQPLVNSEDAVLLESFHALNKDGKTKLLDLAEDLVCSGRYKKEE